MVGAASTGEDQEHARNYLKEPPAEGYSPSMNTRSFLLAILPLVAASTACTGSKPSDSDSPTSTDSPSTTDSVPPGQAGTGCMEVEPDSTCPDPEDVDPSSLRGSCGSTTLEVTGAGTYQDDVDWWDSGIQTPGCCYPILETEPTCDYGRPLLVEGQATLAEIVRDEAWSAGLLPQEVPEEVRQELVKRWTRAALDEHASVAAFSKVSLDLMRFGAPPELLARTHQAAIDEVRHAQLGFALASAFAGQPVGPGSYPLARLPLAEDLVQLAVEAALEGCIGETLASLLAAQGAERAQDPALKRALGTIARDEQQHSLLAWRTVRWALDVGGEPVRQALLQVFSEAARKGIAVPQAPEIDLSRWGLLSQEDSLAVAADCLRGVVLPAARALLEEPLERPAPSGATLRA